AGHEAPNGVNVQGFLRPVQIFDLVASNQAGSQSLSDLGASTMLSSHPRVPELQLLTKAPVSHDWETGAGTSSLLSLCRDVPPVCVSAARR
ncbi:MAG TPA: hypothetical protein V6D30_23720, partial [Leptolyngbyaceae cyanobacterium]